MADETATPSGEPDEADVAELETEAVGDATGEDIAEADAVEGEDHEEEDDEQNDDDDELDDVHVETEPRISHVRLATIAGLVIVLALAALTGWLGYRAYGSHQTAAQRTDFLAVGRQGAIDLTTIDFANVDADVKRILDSATGTFYNDFQQRAQPFADVVKQLKSKSVGSVTEAGLESPVADSATDAKVLVAVTVNTSLADQPPQPPRAWRMRISVQKVGDDAKVSNVEFVQ